MSQADHDRMHPGKICGTCPNELAHRESLNEPEPPYLVLFLIITILGLVGIAVVVQLLRWIF